MSRPVYRRGQSYALNIRDLIYLSTHPERDNTLDAYKLALVRAVRERITRRELDCMSAYYVHKRSMADASRMLDINISTVSRNIKRGERKLDQLIRLAREISPIHFDLTA
jgi:DNA-directed RNA polymerase specialized sigma24 family protein